jgi:hypothetical protein
LAAAALLIHINADPSHDTACKLTVAQIFEHFEQKELRSGDSFRSIATVKTYRGYIRKWVKPRWGSFYLDEVKAVEVVVWLRRLPMARSSPAKIRNVVSILFNHACASLRVMTTGSLRACTREERPYWGASILRKYVRPIAESLNIQKRIGWHTFRHTYSTLLRSVGAEFKVMQELMRHSTLRTTMDVYTQAVAPAKHAAQAAVLALFFPASSSEDDEAIIGTA